MNPVFAKQKWVRRSSRKGASAFGTVESGAHRTPYNKPCGHDPLGCVRFFYDTGIHEARFAEKEEKYHLPIAKKRSL